MSHRKNARRAALSRRIAARGWQSDFTLRLGWLGTLVANTMGGLVAMEAMVRLSQRGEVAALDNIAPVLLIMPDLYGDLFAERLRQTCYPDDRFLIAVNNWDRALALSGFIPGNRDRIGRDIHFKGWPNAAST